MVFSSLIFIFTFLPLALLAYYAAPKRLRNLMLLIASLLFYAWGEPIYIVIIVLTTIANYFFSLLIGKHDGRKTALVAFIASLLVNLGTLFFFKYYDFAVENLNQLFHLQIAVQNLPLPLGISFHTFQTMSYVIDVYRRRVPVQRNFITYSTYIMMFPQMVAGPIVKYADIHEQLTGRQERLVLFGEGMKLFLIGLAKKVLLANNIALLWQGVKATPSAELSVLTAWLGILAFAFQIYFDFSGYSDMAVGLGKMFGFNLPRNFNYPYISKNITEFWRRWHISLGSWFKEYVYIPLGGSREGRFRQYRNILVVWFLTGLWHGASWNFIFWGLYFCLFVTLEKIFLLKWLEKMPSFFAHLYALLVIVFGWVWFEFDQLGQGLAFASTLFGMGAHPLFDSNALYYLSTQGLFFILLAFCSTPVLSLLGNYLKNKLGKYSVALVSLIYIVIFFVAIGCLVNESYNPFLYFRF